MDRDPGSAPQLFCVIEQASGFASIHHIDLVASLVGRSDESTILLADAAVSRRHAMITWLNGQAFIRDLGSVNGTTVDGQRIQNEATLRDGTEIVIRPFTLTAWFSVGAAFRRLCDLQASTQNENPHDTGLKRPRFRRPELSAAEFQIYERLMRGMSEKEVATDLNLTINLANSRIKSVYKALSNSSRSEMLCLRDKQS